MNEIHIFRDAKFGDIRVKIRDGEPWFVASDVCKVLELTNPSTAVQRLDDDEKSKFNLGLSGGSTNVVNEYGLYNLVLSSRKPEAKEFKRWITHEVIPEIRKVGGYMVATDESDEDLMARALLVAQETIERKNRMLQRHVETIKALEPDAKVGKALTLGKGDMSVGDLAKYLSQNGYRTGQNRLFKTLVDDGYLIYRRSQYSPTQRAMEQGLFRMELTQIQRSDGSVQNKNIVRVTPKGVSYFTKRYL